jgi:CBS-domain-containing membrane protein
MLQCVAMLGIAGRMTRRPGKQRRIDPDQFNSAKLRSICRKGRLAGASIRFCWRARDRSPTHWNLALYKFLEATVADHMTRSVKSVSREITMRELEDQFERDDYNAYPVVEEARVVGLVTKYDFLNCFAFHPTQMLPHYDDLMNRTVGDIMTPDFIYVHADTKLTRVLQLMVEHQTRSIPVLDADRKLEGIISREDVIKALASFTKQRS